MICPKDVLQWFKTLECYERIHIMCSLLEECLPFELRFLGTCLEELGRRDSPKMRDMELRANNPQDLAADMHNCQKGEPTDKKVRRKMALYLALIRACNRNCVNEIFCTLECWGERDFANMSDRETLLELLLVYTMAAKHPVFSYHQTTKCGEILAKIKEIKYATDEAALFENQQQEQQQQQQLPQIPLQQHQHQQVQQQQTQTQQLPQHYQQQPPPHFHPPMMQMVQPQVTTSMIFPQQWPKLLPTNDVDGMQHLIQPNITIPNDSNAIAAATAWSMRGLYASPPPQQVHQSLDHQVPPQASSPMQSSQQSSPSSSRTASPQRERGGSAPLPLPQQQIRSLSQRGVKNVRRPSVETTPPPPSSSSSIGTGESNLASQHVKHLEENINDGGSKSIGAGLPSIIRNSFPRAVHQRSNANVYMPTHQHQQQSPVGQQAQQPPQQHYQTNNYIKTNSNPLYGMHSLHITDDGSMRSINSSKSAATTGSESGSPNGSCGETSPPETPTSHPIHCTLTGYQQQQQQQTQPQQHQQQQQQQKHHLSYKQQQLNLQRLNGRNGVEKSYQQIYSSSNHNDVQVLQQQQQQQALLISPSAVSTPTSTVLLQPQQQQQQQQQPPTGTAYNAATYPYHTANSRGLTQTLIQTHTAPNQQAMHGPFRFPHNGEVIYSYHTGLPYPSVPVTATPAGATSVVTGGQLRNTVAAVGVVSTNAITVQTPMPTTQQQQQLLAATNATTPYSVCPITGANSAVVQKIMSCYNCGSQTHSGRDCQEASMEDVTRSATYKLDYSTATSINSGLGDNTEHKDVSNIQKNATVTTATAAVVGNSVGK